MINALRTFLGRKRTDSVEKLRNRLDSFRKLVRRNDRILALIAEASEKTGGDYLFDRTYLRDLAAELREGVEEMNNDLAGITGRTDTALQRAIAQVDAGVRAAMDLRIVVPHDCPRVIRMEDITLEHADAVGRKMARLGEIGGQLDLRVPEGFVLTTRACQEFFRACGIPIDSPAGNREPAVWSETGLDPEDVRERILRTRFPGEISRAIRREVAHLARKHGERTFAVRSSAPGEDGDVTGAGQYRTLLGVNPADLCDAYREVLASLWSPHAVAYQRGKRVFSGQSLMAVGFQAMVPARSSGVAYSIDPLNPERGVQVIATAWGLGRAVVDGEEPVDRFEIRRAPGFPVASRQLGDKKRQYLAAEAGGVVTEELEDSLRRQPSLSDPEAAMVANATCRIERYMKRAQDVEWALDSRGSLVILQARPLRVQPPDSDLERGLAEVPDRCPVLMTGRGEVACRGIGYGKVVIVDETTPADLPLEDDVVLVARSASPTLGAYVARANAVLTDMGSTTGHFATVAREARVPTIVGTDVATETFHDGQEVTVDAEENIVYTGRVEELLHYQLVRRSSFEDAAEFLALRGMLRHIAPLHLHDPQAKEFSPVFCTTYHDIVRFAHEKAVESLTRMAWVQPDSAIDCVRRVKLPIPLDLILVDLGGGVAPEARARSISLSEVRSGPLIPLLEALCLEGGWETAPADMDMSGFMSSATRSQALTTPGAAKPAQNLAIVSSEYLHLSLRVGYHYNVVDTFLTERPNDNYIYFRFLGGVTDLTRRSRRAKLLRRILERQGFVVEGKQDLVIGRTRALPRNAMLEQLVMAGRLIGFVRQLDIFLRDDASIQKYEERFMAGEKVQLRE